MYVLPFPLLPLLKRDENAPLMSPVPVMAGSSFTMLPEKQESSMIIFSPFIIDTALSSSGNDMIF